MQFDLAAIEQAISSYCTRAVEKMRAQNLLARRIEVFLQTNRFRKDLLQDNQTVKTSFIIPTDDLRLIVKTAKQCLQKIFKQGFLYKKAGVVLGDLTASHIRQFDIFDRGDFNQNQQSKKFMDVLDKINKKYGRSTLKLAAEGYDKKWSVRSDLKSPSYTTRWDEVAEVIMR